MLNCFLLRDSLKLTAYKTLIIFILVILRFRQFWFANLLNFYVIKTLLKIWWQFNFKIWILVIHTLSHVCFEFISKIDFDFWIKFRIIQSCDFIEFLFITIRKITILGNWITHASFQTSIDFGSNRSSYYWKVLNA